MTAVARFVQMELEAFRGFATKRVFDLDAETILIRGDNGTGKTSVTDGLLWLLTGVIPRLQERGKGMRKEALDPIVSRYRIGEKARVALVVRIIGQPDSTGNGAEEVKFERLGDSRASTLRADRNGYEVHGEEAEALLATTFGNFLPSQFCHAVSSWGVLQQHALLAALDGGSAMHERLAEMVGLERVNRFVKSASDVSKRAKSEFKHAEQVHAALQEKKASAAQRLRAVQQEEVPSEAEGTRIRRLVEGATRNLPVGFELKQPIEEMDEAPKLLREVEGCVEGARTLVGRANELRSASGVGSEAIETIEAKVKEVRQQAEKAIARAPAQVQMADAALHLLGDECPLCGQQIDEDSVRKHLEELLENAQQESARASEARSALERAEIELQGVRLAEARRLEAQKRVEGASQQLRSVVDNATWVRIDSKLIEVGRVQELGEALESLDRQLREAFAEVRRSGGMQVVGLRAELESRTGALEKAEADVGAARSTYEKSTGLDKAAREAAERIVERALQRLQPSLAEVFDRLSPHPTFAELQAKQDIYYGKNQVVPHAFDPRNKTGGHPALIFSEGQLNVVALSYFLGLALNAGDGALPFIVLDDTLAAMDVLNVLGFADLCRRLREKRQLILTTHDRRFAGLLGRKLAPREYGSRTVLIELDGWTEEGPQVKVSDEPFAEVVPLPIKEAS